MKLLLYGIEEMPLVIKPFTLSQLTMYESVQRSALSPNPLFKSLLISLLMVLGCISCSKNETVLSPGKPVNTTRNFEFNVTPANQFDEEASRKISLKLKLSMSRINITQNAKEILWDTIITRENLYEFTREPGEIISTNITASTEVFQKLLFSYVIIYNHNGALITRSETATVRNSDSEKLVVRL